jgi:hypothetical protein
LHYLELLLAQRETDRVNAEIAMLRAMGVVADAKFLEVQARAHLAEDQQGKAAALLDRAAAAAKREGDRLTEGTVLGNLVMLRHKLGRLDRDQASRKLAELMSEFPDNDAIAVNFAEIARTRSEASVLRRTAGQRHYGNSSRLLPAPARGA